MVKWTTHIPHIGFSESDSKFNSNFKFCEGINHNHFQNTLTCKTKQFKNDKMFCKENLQILEDGANGVQIGE